MKFTPFNIVVGSVVLTVAAFSAIAVGSMQHGDAAKPGKAAQADEVAAVVNGESISRREIAAAFPGLATPVALDEYVNRVIFAQAATKNPEWVKDANGQIEFIKRGVLSDTYLTKTSQKLAASVTDEEIKDYYERNVSDAMFARYKAQYALFPTQEEAVAFGSSIASGDKDAKENEKKLMVFEGSPDGAFRAEQFPYDLGRVISAMNVGGISNPLPTRNGFFVIKLNQVIAGKKPDLKEIKGDIARVLATRKLSDNLADLRKSAKIELK